MKRKMFTNVASAAALGAALVATPASSETLVSVGSDTLEHLMAAWTAEFKKQRPDVDFDVTAAGSSTAPPALVAGTSHFGPMSRKMKSKEVKEFEVKYGYRPTPIRVALDALAVFVHKDNPIVGMSMDQVDSVFSSGRKCGGAAPITNWNDLDVSESRPIELFGRDSNSGTRGYFKKRALCKGDLSDAVAEIPSSEEIVERIAQTPNAMGYSGIGYATPGVRAVPLAKKSGSAYAEATPENAVSGKYPLSRFLYIYVNKKPGEPLPAAQSEFLQMVLSPVGQRIVADHGFIPLPEKTVRQEAIQVAQK